MTMNAHVLIFKDGKYYRTVQCRDARHAIAVAGLRNHFAYATNSTKRAIPVF
jgi:hypothetical protein